MKRPNLEIMETEEGKAALVTGTENILNEVIKKKIPNLNKEMPIEVQETYRAPNILEQKRKYPLPAHNNQTTYTEQRKII